MANFIVAGVGTVSGYDRGVAPSHIFTANTLQEQSMSLSVSAEDIRG